MMKEITLTFTADELVELAKQLSLGFGVTIGFPYDNEKMALDIFNRVCETGYDELPELDAFMRCGPLNDTEFALSPELDDQCEVVVEQFEVSAVEKHLPYALADRDFREKHGKLEVMEVLNNPELLEELQAIQEKYKQEFERYGVIHLRLEEGRG
jgi:hypothetical protein